MGDGLNLAAAGALLVLFTGLFVVNNATQSTGLPPVFVDHLAGPCGSRRPAPLGSEPNAYTADAVKVSC
jgi:hypothetical protein